MKLILNLILLVWMTPFLILGFIVKYICIGYGAGVELAQKLSDDTIKK